MDKDSVVTQYIICECGDNFPNEKLLNIHLANDHGHVETFQCEFCPEILQNEELLKRHIDQHKQKKNETTKPSPKDPKPKTKGPPVIKVQSLKRIDSISLIQGLQGFRGLLNVNVATPAPVQESVEVELPPEVITEEITNPVFVKSEIHEEDEGEDIYYQCDVCNSIFYTEADFNVHYQSTHALKMEVTAEDILEDHLVTDHNVPIKMEPDVETAYYYECEMCHKIFASEEFFNRHYNRVHASLVQVEREVNAEQIMPDRHDQAELALHQDQDYSIDAFKSMEEAEESMADPMVPEETLVPDETLVPEEPSKTPKAPEQVIYFKCDFCKILFPTEKGYNNHFNKKHASLTQGFQLIEQDIAGAYPPAAAPDKDDFCCEFCPKTFNVRRSLQVHRKRVHADRLPRAAGARHKPHNRSKVCDICGRAYNSSAALRYHQRRHTGEKPYPCTMCPKRFTMPMFLQIHLRTHTGEKPYECQQCPKAFTNKAALIRHDRVHTGIKPYPCPECGKFFTQSNSMKLHVSTVHLKLPAPYKSKNRRNKSEARALQLALKSLPTDIIEEDVIDD